MKRLFLLGFMLVGCASWAPTRNAILRQQAWAKLKGCMQYNCQFEKQCVEESVKWCRSNGLESGCGTDSAWTASPGERIMCSPANFH